MDVRLFRIAARDLLGIPGQILGRWTDAPVSRPAYIKAAPTFRCMCRCEMCHLWKENYPEMTTDQWRQSLQGLHHWLGTFHVGFSGGEPLIRKDMLDILGYGSRELELLVGLVSNGYLIDKEIAGRLMDLGLFNINISLDSLKPELHNRLRGADVWSRAVAALKHLRRARRQVGGKTSVIVKTTLMQCNLDEICELTDWAKNEGFSGILVQPLEQPFGEDRNAKWFESNPYWFRDCQAAAAVVDELIARKARGDPVLNSLGHLQSIREYVLDPGQGKSQSSRQCPVGINNLTIYPNGDLALCTEMPVVGNLTRETPRQIWRSTEARKRRGQIRRCRKSCTLTCHVRLSFREKIQLARKLLRRGD